MSYRVNSIKSHVLVLSEPLLSQISSVTNCAERLWLAKSNTQAVPVLLLAVACATYNLLLLISISYTMWNTSSNLSNKKECSGNKLSSRSDTSQLKPSFTNSYLRTPEQLRKSLLPCLHPLSMPSELYWILNRNWFTSSWQIRDFQKHFPFVDQNWAVVSRFI